jgi:hypothetical protein
MTKNQLNQITLVVIAIYAVAIIVGIALRVFDSPPDWIAYSTYKDLLPLIIAIPAAYLAFSFQRRGAYAQALRGYWSLLVRAVQGAYIYTYLDKPTQEQYSRALLDLRIAIDEARGIFQNLPVRKNPNGWYPFEPIREIHNDLEKVGYGGKASKMALGKLRSRIAQRWRLVRIELLREFDRDIPTYHYTWYSNLSDELPNS